MIYSHRQMRDQGTLDVPYHLLRRELCRREYVNLIDGPAVSRNNSRRDNTRKSQDQLLRTLDREDAASDRGRQAQARGVGYKGRLARKRAASMGINTDFCKNYYRTGMSYSRSFGYIVLSPIPSIAAAFR